MGNIKGLLKADLRRGFLSWGFCAAVLLMFISLFIPWLSDRATTGNDKASFFQVCFVYIFTYTVPIVAILPFNGIYHNEAASGFIKFVILRASKKSYIFSKLFSSAVAAFAAAFLGIVLFGVCCAAFHPNNSGFSGSFISEPYGIVVLRTACAAALFCAVWSLCGLMTSAMANSRFFSFVFPFMLFFLINYILPEFRNISQEAEAAASWLYPMSAFSLAYPNTEILRALLPTAVYAVLFSLLFSHFVRKRGIHDA